MRVRWIVPALLGLLLVAVAAPPALALEQITYYRSDIAVNKDGSMNVLETIQVISEHSQINHGIYRDFPTRYKDRYGNNVRVAFDVQAVTRDGAPEPYHTSGMSNGVRLYIGDADTIVSLGEHTYTIAYTANRQLGFFKDHDELYWNVTGNGWVYPIAQAAAVVTLPTGVPLADIKTKGWTGPQGSTDQSFQEYTKSPDKVVFKTTSALNPYDALTIAISWPKGFVNEPTQATRAGWFLRDNRSALICLIGLIIVIGYFSWAQMKVGIDPKRGAIVPQWDPPDGLSPAAIRYINQMGSDNKALTAALINAAVKGYIELKEEDGAYMITRKGTDKSVLSAEELAALDCMLAASGAILLDNANSATFQTATTQFTNSLDAHYGQAYFASHAGYAVVGIVLSVLTMVAALIVDPLPSTGPEGTLTVMLGLWTVFTAALITKAVSIWQDVARRPFGAGGAIIAALYAIVVTVSVLLAAAAEVYVVGRIAGSTSVPILIAVFVFACVNMIFFSLLRAYTPRGRQLMDKVEGLRLYMTVAEQERLNILNPPDRTPQLYEKLLPYALALGVEQQWSEQLADVLEKAQAEGYHPGWYIGPGYSGFASSLGNSFSSAISSASTPPGSSGGGGGGFGGGGSSGGGGGGGGGGGW